MGGFLTNANDRGDLAGPFDNAEINTPFGSIAGEWGKNGNGRFIWQISVTAGPSAFAGVAKYKTYTCVLP